MIDRRSRYATTPILAAGDTADGAPGDQGVLDLRVADPPGSVLQIVPDASDRVDTLAWRYYRDAARYWRICDASAELDPYDVVSPGYPLPIPPDT